MIYIYMRYRYPMSKSWYIPIPSVFRRLTFQGIDFRHTAVGVAGAALPPVKAGDGIVVVGRGPCRKDRFDRFNRYNSSFNGTF